MYRRERYWLTQASESIIGETSCWEWIPQGSGSREDAVWVELTSHRENVRSLRLCKWHGVFLPWKCALAGPGNIFCSITFYASVRLATSNLWEKDWRAWRHIWLLSRYDNILHFLPGSCKVEDSREHLTCILSASFITDHKYEFHLWLDVTLRLHGLLRHDSSLRATSFILISGS